MRRNVLEQESQGCSVDRSYFDGDSHGRVYLNLPDVVVAKINQKFGFDANSESKNFYLARSQYDSHAQFSPSDPLVLKAKSLRERINSPQNEYKHQVQADQRELFRTEVNVLNQQDRYAKLASKDYWSLTNSSVANEWRSHGRFADYNSEQLLKFYEGVILDWKRFAHKVTGFLNTAKMSAGTDRLLFEDAIAQIEKFIEKEIVPLEDQILASMMERLKAAEEHEEEMGNLNFDDLTLACFDKLNKRERKPYVGDVSLVSSKESKNNDKVHPRAGLTSDLILAFHECLKDRKDFSKQIKSLNMFKSPEALSDLNAYARAQDENAKKVFNSPMIRYTLNVVEKRLALFSAETMSRSFDTPQMRARNLFPLENIDEHGNPLWLESTRLLIERSREELKKLQNTDSALYKNINVKLASFQDHLNDILAKEAADVSEVCVDEFDNIFELPIDTTNEIIKKNIEKWVADFARAKLFIDKVNKVNDQDKKLGKSRGNLPYLPVPDVVQLVAEKIADHLKKNPLDDNFKAKVSMMLLMFNPDIGIIATEKLNQIEQRFAGSRSANIADEIRDYLLKPANILTGEKLLAVVTNQAARMQSQARVKIRDEKGAPEDKLSRELKLADALKPTFSLRKMQNSKGASLEDVPESLSKFFDVKGSTLQVKAGGERELFLKDEGRISLIKKINTLGGFVTASQNKIINLDEFKHDTVIQSFKMLDAEITQEIKKINLERNSRWRFLYNIRHGKTDAMQKAWLAQLTSYQFSLKNEKTTLMENALSESAISAYVLEGAEKTINIQKLYEVDKVIRDYADYPGQFDTKYDLIMRIVRSSVTAEFEKLLTKNPLSEVDIKRWNDIIQFLQESSNSATDAIKALMKRVDGRNPAIGELVAKVFSKPGLKFSGNYSAVADYAEKRFEHALSPGGSWAAHDANLLMDRNDLLSNRDRSQLAVIFNRKLADSIGWKETWDERPASYINFANVSNTNDYRIARINAYLSLSNSRKVEINSADEVELSLEVESNTSLQEGIARHINDPWTPVVDDIIRRFGSKKQKQDWNFKWFSWALSKSGDIDAILDKQLGINERLLNELESHLRIVANRSKDYIEFFGEQNLKKLYDKLRDAVSSYQNSIVPPISIETLDNEYKSENSAATDIILNVLEEGTIANRLYKYFDGIGAPALSEVELNAKGKLLSLHYLHAQKDKHDLAISLNASVKDFILGLKVNPRVALTKIRKINAENEDAEVFFSHYTVPLNNACKKQIEKTASEFSSSMQNLNGSNKKQLESSYSEFLLGMKKIVSELTDLPSELRSLNENLSLAILNNADYWEGEKLHGCHRAIGKLDLALSPAPKGLQNRFILKGVNVIETCQIIKELIVELPSVVDRRSIEIPLEKIMLSVEMRKAVEERKNKIQLGEFYLNILEKLDSMQNYCGGNSLDNAAKLETLFLYFRDYINEDFDVLKAKAAPTQENIVQAADAITDHFRKYSGDQQALQVQGIMMRLKGELKVKNPSPVVIKEKVSPQSASSHQQSAPQAEAKFNDLIIDKLRNYFAADADLFFKAWDKRDFETEGFAGSYGYRFQIRDVELKQDLTTARGLRREGALFEIYKMAKSGDEAALRSRIEEINKHFLANRKEYINLTIATKDLPNEDYRFGSVMKDLNLLAINNKEDLVDRFVPRSKRAIAS